MKELYVHNTQNTCTNNLQLELDRFGGELETILEALKLYAEVNAKKCVEAIEMWDNEQYLECDLKTKLAWQTYDHILTASND